MAVLILWWSGFVNQCFGTEMYSITWAAFVDGFRPFLAPFRAFRVFGVFVGVES